MIARFRRLLPLLLFLPLAACIEFQPLNTISWSPSGKELAFVSNGRLWLFNAQNEIINALAPGEPAGILAWSPSEDLLAISTGTTLGFLRRRGGAMILTDRLSVGRPPEGALPLISWHPSGERLLLGVIGDKIAWSNEIMVNAATSAYVGAGIGVYGPGGEWTVWYNQMAIGREKEHLAVDRQGGDGKSLPLTPEEKNAMDLGAFSLLAAPSENSPFPLCVMLDKDKKATDFRCFSREGKLRTHAKLPVSGNIFPNVNRDLFAVVDEKDDKSIHVFVYDAKGKKRAEGKSLTKAIAEQVPFKSKNRRGSRLAWSPDGNWIAWVLDDALLLWNWRNDFSRVYFPS